MCNELHTNSKPIPKEGEGWKLFEVKPEEPQRMLTWMYSSPYESINGQVVWQDKIDDGFCFFPTLSDAARCLHEGDVHYEVVLRKIHYQGGLGKHKEPDFGHKEIALCKSFTLSKTAVQRGDHF